MFIGSSGEAVEYAAALQRLLIQSKIDAEVWDEGVIDLSHTTIEGLIQASRKVDFAVFLLTADDVLQRGVVKRDAPRDNVLFEVGLFMGRLGRNRVFLVYEADRSIHILSDLAGVTYVPFERPQDAREASRALMRAASKIKDHVERLGPRRVSRRFRSAKEAHEFMYALMEDPDVRTIHQLAIADTRFTFGAAGVEFPNHLKKFLKRDATRFWYLYRHFNHLAHRRQLARDLCREFPHCSEVREAGDALPPESRYGLLLFGNKYAVVIDQPALADGVFARVSGPYVVDLGLRLFRALWAVSVAPSLDISEAP